MWILQGTKSARTRKIYKQHINRNPGIYTFNLSDSREPWFSVVDKVELNEVNIIKIEIQRKIKREINEQNKSEKQRKIS